MTSVQVCWLPPLLAQLKNYARQSFSKIPRLQLNLGNILPTSLKRCFFKGYCFDKQAAGWGGSDPSQVCQVSECAG